MTALSRSAVRSAPVLPEVVAENPQRVSGAEEQPDTFSEVGSLRLDALQRMTLSGRRP